MATGMIIAYILFLSISNTTLEIVDWVRTFYTLRMPHNIASAFFGTSLSSTQAKKGKLGFDFERQVCSVYTFPPVGYTNKMFLRIL